MQISNSKPQALTTEQLQKLAPAVFAAHAAPTTSSRYAFVPTSEVVAVLARQGFEPVSAQEKRVRIEARRGFQSHVIRFRRRGDGNGQDIRVGDSIYEILLKTAHDGTSAFDFSAALFRLVCLNGLVAPAGEFGGFSMKHVGYASRDVILGVESMLDSLPQLATSVKQMQEVMLAPAEQRILAEECSRLRWGAEVPVAAERLVAPRRRDDVGSDLWKTFNVIQENLVNGGVRGANVNGRRMRTRAVTGVDAGVRLNRELWSLAEAMGKLKRGEAIESIAARG